MSALESVSNYVSSMKVQLADVNQKRMVEASDFGLRSVRGSFGYYGDSSAAMFANQASQSTEQSRSQRQYLAFKNTVATALRPVMVRFASQPIRVGVTTTRKELNTRKEYSLASESVFSESGERIVKEYAPAWIKASIGSNVTPLESHPLLTLMESPNEFITQNGLLQCTAASLTLTGRVVWWFDSSGSVRPETGMATRIWYLPCHWVTPSGPPENPFGKYKIQMPTVGEIEVDGNDIFYAVVPHPEDPTRSWSAVQSQAASVDTDENILSAQHTSMKNVIRPSLIITAGRMGTMQGGRMGPRATLDRTAREALTEAIKGHYQGVMKFGEPLILDAMIEDVKPLMARPLELDLLNSSNVTQSRIMQGIGTSPVVAGYSENANRAGSVVAHEIFYELVLNPLISLFGQSLDVMAHRRYGEFGMRGSAKRRFRVWMDEAKPRDAEQIQSRVETCLPAMKVKEIREYLKSGNLMLEDATEFDDMLMEDYLARNKSKPSTQDSLQGSGLSDANRIKNRTKKRRGDGRAKNRSKVTGN